MIECNICMESFLAEANKPKSPVSLPCGHSICLECRDKLFKHKKNCPTCQAKISPKVVFNFALIEAQNFRPKEERAVIKAQNTKQQEPKRSGAPISSVPCSECAGADFVAVVCQVCEVATCQGCFDVLHSTVSRRTHECVPWTSSYVDPRSFDCKVHPKHTCELVCETCDGAFICNMCHSHGEHKDHKTVLVSDAATKNRQVLLDKVDELEGGVSSTRLHW